MKLYSTVTSERASKGQGGNKYIYIDLLVGDVNNQINIGRVSLVNNDDKFILQYHETLESDGIPLKTILKGKSQKGESFKYHENARYIDCRGIDKDYCDKCGYTKN